MSKIGVLTYVGPTGAAVITDLGALPRLLTVTWVYGNRPADEAGS